MPDTRGPGWQQHKSACIDCFPVAAPRELMAECPLGGVCAAQEWTIPVLNVACVLGHSDTSRPSSNGLCKWVQETVTDSAARHQLCVRICSRAASDDGGGACAESAPISNGVAADTAFGSCTQGGSAALTEETPEQSFEHVAKHTIGMSVSAPPGVEVITDVWTFKRRQALFPSPK